LTNFPSKNERSKEIKKEEEGNEDIEHP